MKPEDKLGTKFTPRARARHGDGFSYGYEGVLDIQQTRTDILLGEIKEGDLETVNLTLSPYDLSDLKKLLANFNRKTLRWKEKMR